MQRIEFTSKKQCPYCDNFNVEYIDLSDLLGTTHQDVIRIHTNRLKFEVVDSLVFEDKKSAKDDDREGYKRMIGMAKEGGHFKAILCMDDDRFMRDAELLLREIRILKDEYNTKVYFRNFEGMDI